MPTQKLEKIDLSFGVELDVTEVAELQAAFELAPPGSARRDAIYTKVKSMFDQASARLEGEMMAHMNIARQKLKALYKL